jgi:hypothetical protein
MSKVNALYDVIQKELDSISFHAVHFFRFVNHFYGCISVLEMLAQNELMGTADIAHIDFSNIGKEFGFFTEGLLSYRVATLEYETTWKALWEELSLSHDLSVVDAIEEKTFIMVEKVERSRGLSFFKRALSQQALTADQVAMISELLSSSDIGLAKPETNEAIVVAKPENHIVVVPEVNPELKVEKLELSQSKITPTEAKPEVSQAKPELLQSNNEKSKPNPEGPQLKTVDLNQAASLIQKRFRKTRRHRASTPMVNYVNKRVTAFTHRRKRT